MSTLFPRALGVASLMLAGLLVSRPAHATCGPIHCALTPVDQSCQPVAEGTALTGDAVRLHVTCTVQCCSGPANCGQSAYEVSADTLQLLPYVETDSGAVPDKDHPVRFSAHPSCADVYVAESCVASGKYYFEGSELEVTGSACSDESGGCAVGTSRSSAPAAVFLTLLLGTSLSARRRRPR